MFSEIFFDRMKQMLGEEWDAYQRAMEEPPKKGVRLNTLKADKETLQRTLPFPLTESPFSPLSFVAPDDFHPGRHPLHHAGAFYSQEPSASSAVTVLDPQPGEKILDLCAAPGGKSTQIAALLQGKGLLWSNEVVRSRCQVLLSNMERMGVRNAVISQAPVPLLAEKLSGFFDRVLVDAPCSGEGMFRKNDRALLEWSPEHVTACADRQVQILLSAAECVRENGVLVYSTCTFSKEENEGAVRRFLQQRPDFVQEDTGVSFGRPDFDTGLGRRMFPMDGGEGHYVARLRRLSQPAGGPAPFLMRKTKGAEQKPGEDFLQETLRAVPKGMMDRLFMQKEKLLLLPDFLPDLGGIPVLRAGVEVGQVRKGRLLPAHSFYMACRPQELRRVLAYPWDSPLIPHFLHGEAVPWDQKGYAAVAIEGVTVGFGKGDGQMLKNHYPKGLRLPAAVL